MNPKIILLLAIIFILLPSGCATAPPAKPPAPSASGTDIDQDLTNQISATLTECQKIKPGMTRSQLMEVFDTEGGISTAKDRTFVYRRCQYVKIDVHFILSEPAQNVLDERPTDTIGKVSKPYLQWSIMD
jgi:hypothetical protein